LDLILQYLSDQTAVISKISEYNELLRILETQLEQTLKMLERIIFKQSVITPNFDIFELILRRYLQQLKWIFPIGKAEFPPSKLIEDVRARRVWEDFVGEDKYFINFEEFFDLVIGQDLKRNFLTAPSDKQRFKKFYSYFVNFPADNLMSTYKWNLLMKLFGPYDSFILNFSKVAFGKGFVGLVNRIQAQEILTLQYEKKCVLIRLSRTEPEFLAFSFKDAEKGIIGHQLNRNSNNQLIPVEEFLQLNFKGFTLVHQQINLDAILGRHIVNYAETLSGYITLVP